MSTTFYQGDYGRAAGRDYFENQIVNNSYTTYKPLKIVDKIQLRIREQKSSHQDKKALKLGFAIISIIFSFLVSSNFTDIFYNGIFSFLIFSIFFYLIFHIFLFIPALISSKGTLKLEKEKMIFDFGKVKKEINFDNIRSLRKEKNSFGYSFYIYEEEDLYYSVSFYVESIDISLAIEELINYKISKSLNNKI